MRDIDIVITWVDGNDVNWLNKKDKHSPNKKSIKTADVKGRFRDNQELKYLLRSIEKNFITEEPNIFIVVDKQIPDWINKDKDKVKIINHNDFIPNKYLPLFSSRAIETFIHRIPNISDFFIYLNDDCFFNKKIEYNDLFFNGKAIMHFEKNKININDDISVSNFANINAGILASQFIYKKFNITNKHLTAHSPKLIDKKFIFELEKKEPDIFEKTRIGKFREYDSHSIIASLYPHIYTAIGKGEVNFNDVFYMGNNDTDAVKKYKHILDNKHYGVCINDTSDNKPSDDEIFKLQKRFYESMFPIKSKYENLN